jgi:beta-lactamase superfamily II metal-dependent hydrolase
VAFHCAFLDVGHGDCIVVTFVEDGRQACVVVDGGQTMKCSRRLAAYLKATGIEAIDLLVATHIDADHLGGLIQLLRQESSGPDDWNRGLPSPSWVGGSSRPQSMEDEVTLAAHSFVTESVEQNHDLRDLVERHLTVGGEMRYPSLADPPPQPFAGVSIDLLGPDVQVEDTEVQTVAANAHPPVANERIPTTPDELRALVTARANEAAQMADRLANDQSIVLRVTPLTESGALSQWSFMLTGDAGPAAWAMMRARPELQGRLPARVLKLPHHGSALSGMDGESFDLVSPTYCVNSSGQKHGLPDPPTLNRVRSNQRAELFCTERNNSQSHPGPCGSKDHCPRRTAERFKSVLFTVDTAEDTCDARVFDIDETSASVRIVDAGVWCPETSWQ